MCIYSVKFRRIVFRINDGTWSFFEESRSKDNNNKKKNKIIGDAILRKKIMRQDHI